MDQLCCYHSNMLLKKVILILLQMRALTKYLRVHSI